ncbi:hypothetical protein [Flavobacterium aestivum]|uniref:hypothetical protein n=1 Tax=Flavobacterium aestivum TaxID=3003257 RepID=UPI0024821302|nr:hypothetical protein [Flavobacterium aestivum]
MKKILSIFLTLLFFAIFYLFSFVFLTIIDDNTPNSVTPLIRNNFDILWIGLAIILTSSYLFLCYINNKNFNEFSGKLLMVFVFSCLISGLLVFMFGNSPYWFFKYTIGFFVGLLFYLFNRKEVNKKINLLSGVTSIFALLFGEQVEYFLIMDPSSYPTILTIKSFSSIVLWFITILLVFFSAYFFSTGFWKKNKYNSLLNKQIFYNNNNQKKINL